MKKIVLLIAGLAAFALHAEEEGAHLTGQVLNWQVRQEDKDAYGASYATVYAVIDGENIGWADNFRDLSDAELSAIGETSTLAKRADFGSVNLKDTMFFAELFNDNGDAIGTSFAASYDAVVGYIAQNFDNSTVINPTQSGYYAFTFAVPEPSSGLLMLIGFAGLMLRRRHNA